MLSGSLDVDLIRSSGVGTCRATSALAEIVGKSGGLLSIASSFPPVSDSSVDLPLFSLLLVKLSAYG